MYLFRSKTQSGLSLIEMMIVIVAIGILSFAIFHTPDKRTQLDTEARKLASDLRYAQFLAMTQNSKFRITFSGHEYTLSDANNNLYTWPLIGSSTVTIDPYFEFLWDNLVLPNGYIIFDGQGIPYVGPTTKLSTTAVFTLKDGDLTKTVSIVPETGKVGIP